MVDNNIKKITYNDNSTGQKATVYTEAKASYGFLIFSNDDAEVVGELKKLQTGVKNGYLSEEEISIFNQKLEQYAATDGNVQELSETEATALRKELGLSKQLFVKMLNLLGATSLAQAISGSLNGEKDSKNIETLLSELNGDNVYEVFKKYDGDLVKEVVKKYKDNPKPHLDKILNAFKESAEKNNIQITTLIEKYETAMNKKDYESVQRIFDEVHKRFEMREKQESLANAANEEHGDGKAAQKHQTQMVALAKNSGAVVSEDLFGDGVLGNTPSVRTRNKDPRYTYVFNAVKELMRDPEIREKFQACIYKSDHHIFSVVFPGSSSSPETFKNTYTEKTLATNEGRYEQMVVGDAEMSLIVDALIEKLTESSRPFKGFDNSYNLKWQILGTIDPNFSGQVPQ